MTSLYTTYTYQENYVPFGQIDPAPTLMTFIN